MKKISKTIVFFGSGPVAAASLEALANSFEIEWVITKQAPLHHKGSVPVVELANRLHLPMKFANNQQELDKTVAELKFESQLAVVVDYGVIASQEVINAFPLGIINSHFSLLPEWRGADPITFTILSGQKETGVSLMRIVKELDEGLLIAQEKLAVSASITTPELTNQLIEKSNTMLAYYLPEYVSGNIQPYNQPDVPATYSRKLTKADGVIDWTKPAIQLEREVRAFSGWPKSSTNFAGKSIIVTKVQIVEASSTPGEVLLGEKNKLVVACGQHALEIVKLKPAGKQEMSGEAFLAGRPKLR